MEAVKHVIISLILTKNEGEHNNNNNNIHDKR